MVTHNSWFSGFALCLDSFLMDEIISQCDTKTDFIISEGTCKSDIDSVKQVMDQGIQSAITFLFLNRISKTLYRMNRLPMHQNHLLSLFIGSSWKKIHRLLWNNGVSLQNMQNYSFVCIHVGLSCTRTVCN